jgi:hypothetical protein
VAELAAVGVEVAARAATVSSSSPIKPAISGKAGAQHWRFLADFHIQSSIAMKDFLFDASPATAHKFISNLLEDLRACNVTPLVETGLQVTCRDGGKSAGYFDIHPVEFAVAIGKPFDDWFQVLVHEYCHFKQWLEDATAFEASCLKIEKLFGWLAGDFDLDPPTVKQLGRVALELEHDCDRRVLANLETFGISHLIDPLVYAQKSNSYFNFYTYIAKHRKWYVGGKEPYSLQEVWTFFPTTLIVEDELSLQREALYALCV